MKPSSGLIKLCFVHVIPIIHCWPLSVDGSRSVLRPCLRFSSGLTTVCKPHWCCSSCSLTAHNIVCFNTHRTTGTASVTHKNQQKRAGCTSISCFNHTKITESSFWNPVLMTDTWSQSEKSYKWYDIIRKQIVTLDAVVFHQLCTVYQHLRGDISYCVTLEKTRTEQTKCLVGHWTVSPSPTHFSDVSIGGQRLTIRQLTETNDVKIPSFCMQWWAMQGSLSSSLSFSTNYFCHFVRVQTSATLWMTLRTNCKKCGA